MSVVYGSGGARLEAPVSPAIWNEVISRAEFADRQLVDPALEAASSPNSPPGICLHAWNSTVEMTNSSSLRAGAPSRSAAGRRALATGL